MLTATKGTKTAVWINLLTALAAAFGAWLTPSVLTTLGGGTVSAPVAVAVVAGINWILHSLTGNAPAGIVPSAVTQPINLGGPSVSQQG